MHTCREFISQSYLYEYRCYIAVCKGAQTTFFHRKSFMMVVTYEMLMMLTHMYTRVCFLFTSGTQVIVHEEQKALPRKSCRRKYLHDMFTSHADICDCSDMFTSQGDRCLVPMQYWYCCYLDTCSWYIETPL